MDGSKNYVERMKLLFDSKEHHSQRNISYSRDTSSPKTIVETVAKSDGSRIEHRIIYRHRSENNFASKKLGNTDSEKYEDWSKQSRKHLNKDHISESSNQSYGMKRCTSTNEYEKWKKQSQQQIRFIKEQKEQKISESKFLDNNKSFANCSENGNQSKYVRKTVDFKKENKVHHTIDSFESTHSKVPVPKPRRSVSNTSPVLKDSKSWIEKQTGKLVTNINNSVPDKNTPRFRFGLQVVIKMNGWEEEPKISVSEYHETPIPKPRQRIRNTNPNLSDSKTLSEEAALVTKKPNPNSIQESTTSCPCGDISGEVVPKNSSHTYYPNESNMEKEVYEQSLGEKENEEDYIKGLLEQIDLEMDQMRRDGFIDENDNSSYIDLTNNNEFSLLPKNENRDSAVASLSSSNRTTKYSSTASTESCSGQEFDEGIGMDENSNNRKNTSGDGSNNDKEIIDIQEDIEASNIGSSSTSSIGCDSRNAMPSKRLLHIMDEIKSTERKYVDDLTKIVRDFIPYISLYPVELLEVRVIHDLFGCIRDILHHHMKFLREIENSQDIDSIVESLISNKSLLSIYPIYFRNKPKTDGLLDKFSHIFKDMQEKFGDPFDFSTYLLIPIQRLGRYILFLKNIEKEQKKLNISNKNTEIALELAKSEMCKGNTYVAIDSIMNNTLGECYHNYGSFIMREKFDKSKYMVFLFEKVVIFTTVDQSDPEIFHYYNSIKMDDLEVAFCCNNFTIFLTDIKKRKLQRKSVHVLEVKSQQTWLAWKENLSIYCKNLYSEQTTVCR